MSTTWIVIAVVGGVVVGAMLGWLLRGRVCRKAHAGLVSRYEPAGLGTFFPPPERPTAPELDAPITSAEAPDDAVGTPALPGGGAPGTSYVVKAKKASRIYHTTASPSYARTVADLWFETPEAAEAAGYRPPRPRAKRAPTA